MRNATIRYCVGFLAINTFLCLILAVFVPEWPLGDIASIYVYIIGPGCICLAFKLGIDSLGRFMYLEFLRKRNEAETQIFFHTVKLWKKKICLFFLLASYLPVGTALLNETKNRMETQSNGDASDTGEVSYPWWWCVGFRPTTRFPSSDSPLLAFLSLLALLASLMSVPIS